MRMAKSISHVSYRARPRPPPGRDQNRHPRQRGRERFVTLWAFPGSRCRDPFGPTDHAHPLCRQGHCRSEICAIRRSPRADKNGGMARERFPGPRRVVEGGAPVAIAATELVKDFGDTRALDHLNLDVATGEVHGFLGPNGAGKTTTIRILLGMLRKTSGAVSLLGGDPWHDTAELHRRLAYVPGEVNLWPNLTGGEVIDLLGELRGGVVESRRVALLDRFQLDPTKKVRAYSKGNRQKVALVAAFASDVELYLLDEPTSGL